MRLVGDVDQSGWVARIHHFHYGKTMFGLGNKQRIAELEARVAELIAERDELAIEVTRLRPYAGISDIDAAIREHKKRYIQQYNESVTKFKAQLAAAREKIFDEYKKAKEERKIANQQAEELINQANKKADKIICAAKEQAHAEYEKIGDEREAVRQEREEAQKESERILDEAREAADRFAAAIRAETVASFEVQGNTSEVAALKAIIVEQRARLTEEARERKAAEKALAKTGKALSRAEVKIQKAETAAKKAKEQARLEKINAKSRVEWLRRQAEAREDATVCVDETITFNYQDAVGAFTSRTVDVQKVCRRGRTVYLEGYCQLRDEHRTFRASRISGDILVESTGELVVPEDFLSRYI